MSEPGLLDRCGVVKKMNVVGKKRVSLQIQEGNNDRHQGTGPWQGTFCIVRLRMCSTQGEIGSRRFNMLDKGFWLFLDMMYLIMLLASRTNAKRDVMQFWFQEAKDFLVGMEDEV